MRKATFDKKLNGPLTSDSNWFLNGHTVAHWCVIKENHTHDFLFWQKKSFEYTLFKIQLSIKLFLN